MNTILNFFRAGTPESSKRLLTIMSYIVALGLAIFCVIHGVPLEGNVLTLLLGLCGTATAQQVISYGKEVASISKQSTEKGSEE